MLARELTALRIPAAAVLGNHDLESGKAGRGASDSDRRRARRARRRRVRAAGHRHRRREGLRRRLRPARARPVGRDDHQAVRARGGRRGAEARGGAGAPAHRAARSRCCTTRRFSRRSKASRSRSIRSSDRAASRSRSAAIRCRSWSTATRIAASSRARTKNGVPVYNVSMPLLTRTFADRPPFRVFEVPRRRDAVGHDLPTPRRPRPGAAASPTPSRPEEPHGNLDRARGSRSGRRLLHRRAAEAAATPASRFWSAAPSRSRTTRTCRATRRTSTSS